MTTTEIESRLTSIYQGASGSIPDARVTADGAILTADGQPAGQFDAQEYIAAYQAAGRAYEATAADCDAATRYLTGLADTAATTDDQAEWLEIAAEDMQKRGDRARQDAAETTYPVQFLSDWSAGLLNVL